MDFSALLWTNQHKKQIYTLSHPQLCHNIPLHKRKINFFRRTLDNKAVLWYIKSDKTEKFLKSPQTYKE